MAILEPEAISGVTTYTTAPSVYYITWQDAQNWSLVCKDNVTIITPLKLFVQTTVTTQGRLDLIDYVENYTP